MSDAAQTWQLLSALAEASAFVRRGTAEHPQDPVTMRLLTLTEQHRRLRPSEITTILDLSPAAVTRRVRALEQSGYLSAVPDPTDARSYFLTLTESGRHFLAEFRLGLSARFGAVLDGWNAADLTTLVTLLTRLNDDMRRLRAAPDDSRATRPWWRAQTPD